MRSPLTVRAQGALKLGFILLASILQGKLLAQEQPTQLLNLKWVAMSVSDTLRDLYYEGEDGMTNVFIPNGGFTQVHSYRGPNPFRLYRMVETPEGTRPEVAAEITLALDLRAVTLFISSAPKGQLYPLFDTPGTPGELPPQSCRLINLTSHELAGYVGSERFRMMPGVSQLVNYHLGEEHKVLLRLQIAMSDDGAWHEIVSSTIGVRQDTQLTVIFRMDEAGEVKMQPIRQRAYAATTLP